MSDKYLKIKVDGLTEENYIDVANKIAKAAKKAAPSSSVSIIGGDQKTLEGKSHSSYCQLLIKHFYSF